MLMKPRKNAQQSLAWQQCVRGALPLTLGIFMLSGTAAKAYAATPEVNIVQQQSEVRGTVSNDSGEKLAGVLVAVKGTNRSTLTDDNGAYAIKASRGDVLLFSYIGHERKEVKVGSGETEVVLATIDNTLDEAVVIGYGTVRKADLAGSVAVMDNKQFKDQPVTRIEDALQGRIAGVEVVSSGVPGGDLKIRVRGSSSINKSNDPLYVVDGIVRESGLEGLNPEDIQSMQVLKDASSTAIYGSRGANGVVLVQTKKGVEGTTRVVFDAAVGVSNAYNIPEVMGTQEYAQALVGYKGVDASILADYLNGTNPGIDWTDELLRTGVSQNYKLSLSKGNKDTQFYVSGNYMQHQGVITDTKFERYSAKANIHSRIFRWLDLTADVNLSQGNGKGAGFYQSQDNPLWTALNYSPTMEMMNDKGQYNQDPYNCIQKNPLGLLQANENDRIKRVVGAHVDIKFNIVKGLTFTTTNGVDYTNRKGYSFSSSNVMTTNGMANNDSDRMLLQTTNNLTYDGKWNGHGLTVTAVWEATSSETRAMGITGKNLANETVGYWNVQNAATRDASNSYSRWTLLSAVARVMYNYRDRYMLTGTFRADGSSRFSNEKWGYFPSIAAAWNVSEEAFMKQQSAISNMKVRLSYGIIGNQDISPYSTLGTMGTAGFHFGAGTDYSGYWANNPATPDLSWEKVHQFDAGLDISFFKNRLSVSVDYFNKQTKDALLYKTSPSYLGAASYWVNAAEVSNKGVDISITGRIFQNRDFSWTATLNGSYLKNEVVKLTADEPIIYGASPSAGSVEACTIIKEGEAIGTFYGYRWAGLQKQADGTYIDTYYDKDGNITATPTGDDKAVIGCANPDFTLGWNNTLTYKNWDFNVFFNAGFGAQRLNLVRYAMNTMIGASMFVTEKGYFEQVGVDMPTPNVENSNYGNSTKWLEDANYFRCENLSIAYTLPKEKTRGVAALRFSVSAQNLFTITGYKGINPAGTAFSSGNVDVNNGLDMGAYPNPRTFTFGVRATF